MTAKIAEKAAEKAAERAAVRVIANEDGGLKWIKGLDKAELAVMLPMTAR